MLGITQMLVVSVPALKSSTAPVFSQCRPSGVPTLGTVLIGSTGITLGLQPERYCVDCKNWQCSDFSAWAGAILLTKKASCSRTLTEKNGYWPIISRCWGTMSVTFSYVTKIYIYSTLIIADIEKQIFTISIWKIELDYLRF